MHPLAKASILAVDDNRGILRSLKMLLAPVCASFSGISSPERIREKLRNSRIDVVLLDMNFKAGINTGNEGIYWMHEIHKNDPSISVVMITAYGDIGLAVKAVKEGAFDFILKPWDNDKLVSTLQAALKLRMIKVENAKLRRTTDTLKQELNPTTQSIIGQSEAMKKVMEIVKKVAVTDANIFLTGENGTGKELIAREIHRLSKRKNEVLINVDMGSLSESLFESELFGHTKGSFTDAKEDRIGKFETADKGTLFLDEIGNLPLSLQAKLLTSLQNRTIVKLGSNIPVPIDIRLISATNKDVITMIKDGLFREDLFYRINTITIEVPPLRERGNDMILLAEFYLRKYAVKYDKPGLSINPKTIHKFLKYSWPGNVRELQHCMEKAVILTDSKVLNEDCFSLSGTSSDHKINFYNKTIEEMEGEMILACVEKEKGNLSAVAKKLGITRPTLYKKLKKLEA